MEVTATGKVLRDENSEHVVWITWDLVEALNLLGKWPTSEKIMMYKVKSQLATIVMAANPDLFRNEILITEQDIIRALEDSDGKLDIRTVWEDCCRDCKMTVQAKVSDKTISLEDECRMLREITLAVWGFRQANAGTFDRFAKTDSA